MNYDASKYLDYEELTSLLRHWCDENPELLRLESIGKTLQGREIWMVTVNDLSTGPDSEKPAYWVDGNTHAGEVTGCQACVHLLDALVRGFSTGSYVRELLREICFYVVPRISADGAEHFLKSGEYVRSTPLTAEDDKLAESFSECDLDGDGSILTMRIPDPKGAYKISEVDPRVMVPRAPDDTFVAGKTFYSLLPEGEFKNYDGVTKRFLPKYRFDLNRQYPTNFRPEGEQRGAGPFPMFLPEARAVVEAVTARPNIFGLQSFHTFSSIILRPYSGCDDLEMPIPDLEVYKALGSRGETITDYPCVSVHHGFRYHPKDSIGGGFFDWAYEHRGIFAFTNEIWHLGIEAGVPVSTDRVAFFQTVDEAKLVPILAWCDQNLKKGTYFKDWREFEHPQLGKVEIGGWHTKFTWTNPPAQLLAKEIDKNVQFVLACAKSAPLPAFQRVETSLVPASEKTKRVQIVLQNNGYLPTYGSVQGTKTGAVRNKVRVHVKLEDSQRLIAGKAYQECTHLPGFGAGAPWKNSVFPAFNLLNSLDAMPELSLEWVVQGSGVMDIEIDFHRAGTLRKRIEL